MQEEGSILGNQLVQNQIQSPIKLKASPTNLIVAAPFQPLANKGPIHLQ